MAQYNVLPAGAVCAHTKHVIISLATNKKLCCLLTDSACKRQAAPFDVSCHHHLLCRVIQVAADLETVNATEGQPCFDVLSASTSGAICPDSAYISDTAGCQKRQANEEPHFSCFREQMPRTGSLFWWRLLLQLLLACPADASTNIWCM